MLGSNLCGFAKTVEKCESKLNHNKLDADWTYLMMKVSQMREDIDINGKDTEKRMNEHTNEQIRKQIKERAKE